jgi:hypothetical protein
MTARPSRAVTSANVVAPAIDQPLPRRAVVRVAGDPARVRRASQEPRTSSSARFRHETPDGTCRRSSRRATKILPGSCPSCCATVWERLPFLALAAVAFFLARPRRLSLALMLAMLLDHERAGV